MSITTTPEISIDALRAGDRAEFARMVDVHSALIYRLGLKMLGNSQDAEDVLQNTFLNALMHLSSFEGRSSISTWLYRIASNEALMMLRKKQPVSIEDMQAEDSEDGLIPAIFTDWSALPESELLAGESKSAIDAAIAKTAGAIEDRLCSARYRRRFDQGNRRDTFSDRNQCEDPFAACPYGSS
ncbi:sigma-70 family RNA polymerase sigma factor [Candidatus Villigracilis affinis]|uniref:sigma-70 family RNA polymerase sigma factor n=1 Tax=Candidatus Villigracilis affinis TaxID=3140682 RepID=UPI001D7BC2FF|nr:sigma-70 family RNA polymerase sigma factor [Anaerolineales bacterium]